MDYLNILPNILAVVCSFIAIILLAKVATKLGGELGRMLKLLMGGIFFAVFLHAILELATVFGLLTEETLMYIMGILLSLGSLLFILATYFGFKVLK